MSTIDADANESRLTCHLQSQVLSLDQHELVMATGTLVRLVFYNLQKKEITLIKREYGQDVRRSHALALTSIASMLRTALALNRPHGLNAVTGSALFLRPNPIKS